MFPLDGKPYTEAVRLLLHSDHHMSLGPGTPNASVRQLLQNATPEAVAPDAPSNELAACCLSALWLWHDFLDESHEISQDLPSAEGSYWHGIMHRKEPDYSNAKYWYRRVGDHPIFPSLLQRVRNITAPKSRAAQQLADGGDWDPYAFVDLCASAARSGDDTEFSQAVAWAEWELLFDYCYGLRD